MMANEYENQSICIAIQDAVDNIRNVSNIANTASGVALSKLLECGEDSSAIIVLNESNKIIANAIDNYERILNISRKNSQKNKSRIFNLK
jgi:hypothetical protein